MGGFSTLGGGTSWEEIKQKLETEGAFNIIGVSIDDIASKVNEANSDGVALVFEDVYSVDFVVKILNNANLSADKAASILDNTNLSADKAASICDSPNISSSKLKAILDTGKLTNADKIAAILDGDSLTVDDAATHINSGIYTNDLYASAFDSSYLAETKLQAILDNGNLSIQKGQEIVDAMSNPSKIGTGGRRGLLGDDWEDNKLTSRDKAATVATTLDKIFQSFRPEWSSEGTVDVSNGVVTLTGTDSRIYTSTTIAVARWSFRVSFPNAGAGNRCHYNILADSSDVNPHGYTLMFQNKSDGFYFQLVKNDAGSYTNIIDAGYVTSAPDTDWHVIEVTRDENGNFEIFYDGVSKGTGSDTTYTSGNYLTLCNSPATSYSHKIDWVKVV